jgi:nucleotide-binding universal stress UspA family protein
VGTDGTRSGQAALTAAGELAHDLCAQLEVFSAVGPAQARRLFEREAERLDMLVLGAGRHGPLEHSTPVSAIRSLMHRAPLPLVIVPHDLARR